MKNWSYEIDTQINSLVAEKVIDGQTKKSFMRIKRTKLICESFVYNTRIVFTVNKSSRSKAYPFFTSKETGKKFSAREMVTRLTGLFDQSEAEAIVKEAITAAGV